MTFIFVLLVYPACAELTEKQQQRADIFFKITRCPVCDGQPLEGSEAELSQDLKKIIIDKIIQNHTDSEIKTFLITTYGQDILFEPPHNRSTMILNYGPYVMMIMFFVFFLVRYFLAQGQKSNVLSEKKENNIL